MVNSKDLFKKNVNKKELRDAGLAAILLCLLWFYFSKYQKVADLDIPIKIAFIVIFLTMVLPKVLLPFAIPWYTITNFIGFILSRVLLSIIYFLVVLPVGLIRKIAGKDSLKLKHYRKGKSSAFVVRDKTFSGTDLETPY